ncbi:MAG: hypothetical protein R2752_15535 [Vicinamibacterales bacterium]
MRPALRGARGLLALALLLLPGRADAQWYVASFTGANVTRPSTVTLDQPSIQRHLDFHDVTFAAKPLESPQYYGARIGYAIGRGFAIEGEFLHIKVISETGRTVHVTGVNGGVPVDARFRMDAIVQHHAMTHGLNFWLANLVWRHALAVRTAGRPVALVLRAGAGPVRPGVDSIVDHASVQEYQFAGVGGQVAAGLDVPIYKWLSAMLEYKLTRARPVLDIDRGTGRMTALTHHFAAGFAFGFSR